MNRQPVLIMLVFFVLGIFIGEFFPGGTPFICYFITLIIGVIGTSVFISNRFLIKFRSYFLGLFFLLAGYTFHLSNNHSKELKLNHEKQNFVFVLNKKLKSNAKYNRYEVNVVSIERDKQTPSFLVILSISKEQPQLDFEHIYKASAYLNEIQSPENDFQFDYAKYLSRRNIFYQAFVKDEILVAPKSDLTLTEKIKQSRLEVLNKIDESKLTLRVKSFLKGIILADRTEMDEEIAQDFNRSGLVHLLAISGTHFAIIFGALLLFLKPFFSVKQKRKPIIISLIMIWFFAVFIDFGSSVLRSCIMITVYYIFILLERKPDLLHSLSLAAFIILILDSHQLFDVGFQLSFMAVLGIYAFNSSLLKYFPRPKNKIQELLFQVFTVSTSAQLATFPLIVYYFHQYSFVSIFANLIILPFSEIIIIFSLIMTLLYGFGFKIQMLSFVYEKMVEFLLQAIHFFASWENLLVENISFSFLEVLIAFGVLYCLKVFLQRKTVSNGLLFSFSFLILMSCSVLLNVYYQQKEEVLLVQDYNQTVLIQKNKNKVLFWTYPEENKEKLTRQIFIPYLNSRRVQEYEVHFISQDTDEVEINGRSISLR